jgi:hypothetical protein
MLRTTGIRLLLALAALLALWTPGRAAAQDDPNEIPLGDVARNLRKNTPPVKPVIDDDNLTDVMQQNDSRQGFGSSLKYLMAGDGKGLQVAAPDVTCSLAFTANVKSLLSSTQYSQMDLPSSDLAKLEGPAAVEGDALTVTIFNATNWHVSEVAVAFTVVKKAAADAGDPFQEVRPEKKQDTTVIYRMRAAAPPWMRAVFSAPLNLDLGPGDEWHWAIVQAKGYPPQGDGPSIPPAATAAVTASQAALQQTSVQTAVPTEATTPPAQDHP